MKEISNNPLEGIHQTSYHKGQFGGVNGLQEQWKNKFLDFISSVCFYASVHILPTQNGAIPGIGDRRDPGCATVVCPLWTETP